MVIHAGFWPFIAQTLAEYGLLNSITAGISAMLSQLDSLVGRGNSKYFLFALAALLAWRLIHRLRHP